MEQSIKELSDKIAKLNVQLEKYGHKADYFLDNKQYSKYDEMRDLEEERDRLEAKLARHKAVFEMEKTKEENKVKEDKEREEFKKKREEILRKFTESSSSPEPKEKKKTIAELIEEAIQKNRQKHESIKESDGLQDGNNNNAYLRKCSDEDEGDELTEVNNEREEFSSSDEYADDKEAVPDSSLNASVLKKSNEKFSISDTK